MSLKSLKKVYKRRPKKKPKKKNLNQMNIIHGIIFVMIFFFFFLRQWNYFCSRPQFNSSRVTQFPQYPEVAIKVTNHIRTPSSFGLRVHTVKSCFFAKAGFLAESYARKHKTGVAHANQTVSRAQWLLSARGCWVLNVKFTRKGFNCTREMKLFAWFICYGINIIP